MSYQDSILTPVEQVRGILKKAFAKKNRKNRRLFRNIRQALKLASLRGYTQSKEFFDFFNNGEHEEQMAKRLVKKFLAYVSLTEFMQLTAAS